MPLKYLDVKILDGCYSEAVEDEVDQIVTAWQRERPDVNTAPMQVLSRIGRLAQHVESARRAAFSTHDVELWEFDVLAALRRSGRPYELSPGRLITLTHVTSGTMTNRVDRLSDRGFVERRPDPGDRRGVLVALTDSGRDTVDAAIVELMRAESALLAEVPAAARDRLTADLRLLLTTITGAP